MINIKRGLDLPITGAPSQEPGKSRPIRSIAVLGEDYIGMRPTMAVTVGDSVKQGQLLFTDKKTAGVNYTAPGCGTISAINRGDKRSLLSVVIELKGEDRIQFCQYHSAELPSLSREQIVANLVDSGQWTALRTRPYSKVPDPSVVPAAIFVNAMDSNPLAVDPEPVIKDRLQEFFSGINLLSKLTNGALYLCVAPGSCVENSSSIYNDNVQVHSFKGPHPAGLTGTHIHFLDPAGPDKQLWTINYQDVIAVAGLFASGYLCSDRVIALSGPQIENPRLIKTRLGANIHEMTAGELLPGETRLISGSVLSGRTAFSSEAFLGRYHLQVTAIREGRERPFLGWMSPGMNKHSALGIYLSSLFRGRKFPFTTSTNGSDRAMVPLGTFENVMPLDILPTQLLRALVVGDTETAQNLGALELEEEDLALCSYVCSGKYEYGPILRDNLTRIEKES